jgi:hypothetical protein
VPIHDDNKPGNAILTLGQVAGEDGINIKALAKTPGNQPVPFNVRGQIVSDSNINVVSGTLQSNASVRAHTGCSGTIVSTPPPVCASGTVADPNYQNEIELAGSGFPDLQKVPTTCPGKVVTFTPGYYDDANALSQLMDGTGSCKGSVWWFSPGNYYFDFKNNENPLLPKQGGDEWVIKDGQLIAGSPCANRLNPNTTKCTPISKPQVPALTPGACQSPTETTDDHYAGVQFIFGGDSRLTVAAGDVEICGTWHDHRPPIALYGLKSGTASPVDQNGLTLSSVTTPNDYGATATVASLSTADGTAASWKSKKNNDAATVTVKGFAPTSPVPAGSMLKSAVVRIKHRHQVATTTDSLAMTLTPTNGSALPVATATGRLGTTTFQTTFIPVDTAGDGSLADQIYKGTFSGATIGLTTTLPTKDDISDIDTIQLDLTYVPPAFRGETNAAIPGTNCLTLAYTGGSGPCAVFSTTTSYSGKLYLQGTTYTPAAVVDITLSNITQQVLRFGLVSRSLFIKETGALSYSGPVIELPDNSLGYGPGGTIVYLSTYICPGKPTCSSSTGTLLLRSRVFVYDPSGTPEPATRKMVVQSWSRTR